MVASGSNIRNGADVLIKNLFSVLGRTGLQVFNLILLAVFIVVAVRLIRRNKPVFALYVPMLLECLVYALCLAPIIGLVGLAAFAGSSGTARSLGDWPQRCAAFLQDEESGFLSLMLSIGAGVYEEAFFRLGLLTLLIAVGERLLKRTKRTSTLLAVAIGSVLFSAFHHVGPLGDPFTWSVFLFRFCAGVLFSFLYLVRGFGVVVYTHALYDVYVLVLSPFFARLF